MNSKLLVIEDPLSSINKILKIKPSEININIKNIIKSELQSQNYFYTLLNGKLLGNSIIPWDKLEKLNIIRVYYPLNGGNVLGNIIDCVMSIGKFAVLLLQFIEWFGKFVAWLFQALYWAMEILNPYNLIKDFTNTIMSISNQIVLAPLQFIVGLMKIGCNRIFGVIFGSFWGWDKKADTLNDYKSKYYQENKNNKKCYVQNQKVPFSVILGTIFCPPIGVFMTLGLTGWFHILLSTLLTFAFYFPGLLYALLVIYN